MNNLDKNKRILALRFILVSLLVAVWGFVCVKAEDLVNELKSSTTAVRLNAIRKLGISLNDERIRILSEHLLEEKDNYLKVEIMEIISLSGSTVAFNAITKQLEDKNPYMRSVAVLNLGKFKEELSLPILKKVLKEEKNRSVKLTTISAFKNYKSTAAVETLDNLVSNPNEDKDIKIASIKVLGAIGGPYSEKVLKKYSSHPDKELRNIVDVELKKISEESKNKKK